MQQTLEAFIQAANLIADVFNASLETMKENECSGVDVIEHKIKTGEFTIHAELDWTDGECHELKFFLDDIANQERLFVTSACLNHKLENVN